MDQDMDLTFGSLNFRVGSLGSIRLLDSAKLGPSASKSKTETTSESSEGSSSEVNSPVSFTKIETEERKFAEGNETMENFDLEVQLEDLMICHDDTSDKSTDIWKTGLELHEDESSIFSSFDSKFDNRYQVLAIIEDNSEELDENNNPVLNPANINRGQTTWQKEKPQTPWQTGKKFDYQSMNGGQSKQLWSTARQYQIMLAKICVWGTTMP
jgi:hypothetical protein